MKTPKSTPSSKVLTWNIMVDDYNPIRYQKVAEILQQLINTGGVDIICLQEVSVLCSKYLSDLKGVDALYHPLEANSTYRTYGEVILFNPTRLTVVDKGFFLLPSKQGRSVQWATFRTNTKNPITFKIATGHLESNYQGCDYSDKRNKQWQTIIEQLQPTQSTIQTYWVGDCNMKQDESHPPCGTLTAYGPTYFSHRYHQGDRRYPYDRVWTTDSTQPPTLIQRIGFDTSVSLDISDHDGLLLMLSVP